jgi:hypothetical protein
MVSADKALAIRGSGGGVFHPRKSVSESDTEPGEKLGQNKTLPGNASEVRNV